MEEIKVVDWVKWTVNKDKAKFTPEHEDAVIECIIKNRYHFDGNTHQNHEHGMPVFNDGLHFAVSMRYWGGVMADAWNRIDNAFAYDYMDFYMSFSEKQDANHKVPTGEISI
jgi:hypothetical protein